MLTVTHSYNIITQLIVSLEGEQAKEAEGVSESRAEQLGAQDKPAARLMVMTKNSQRARCERKVAGGKGTNLDYANPPETRIT